MRIYTLGGFSEVGRNMTAVEVGREVVIIDMGYHMDKIIGMSDEEREAPLPELRKQGAIPDDTPLKGKNVIAIVVSHGHLDHLGAVPKMADNYPKAPIIVTPYTAEVLKRMAKEEGRSHINNRIVSLKHNTPKNIGKNFSVELVYVTHSIPHSAMVLLRTKEGNVAYLNDFKIDFTPTLEQPFQKQYFKKIGKEGIKVLLMESLRADETSRSSSEKIAKEMLKDVVNRAYQESKNNAVIVSTFSSHIARIKAAIDINKGRREVIMLGRSLKLYTGAAADLGLLDRSKVRVHTKRKSIINVLKEVEKDKEKYLLITTGNQGEYDAVLTRMARGEYPFNWNKNDEVIISSNPIPHPVNIAQRYVLERMLRERNVRIIDGVHASGHARKEDLRDIIRWLNPEILIPSHGYLAKTSALAEVAMQEGYELGKNVLLSTNGKVWDIKKG
ncbi:MAG: MBL fold metallo-hydrolase [Candidatus Nanohaloarchaeota archaeon]|nr:MBL fold metallo-hydrolase [Candidatus Nanohaloarchaeota archaeon]